jgi:hypothetical protein
MLDDFTWLTLSLAPPKTATPVSDQPASPVPAAGVRANTGIMSAQAHSIDLPMLKNMLPLAELMISATARTVQTLARWAAKPSTSANAIAKISVPI